MENENYENTANLQNKPAVKWKSRKFRVVVWACVVVTLICLSAFITAYTGNDLPDWLGTIGITLSGAIITYFPCNAIQKKFTPPPTDEK